MPQIRRVRTVHEGLPGAPYLSTHYFSPQGGTTAQQLIQAVADFWSDCQAGMIISNQWNVQAEIDTIDDTTGDIVSQETGVGVNGVGEVTGTPEWSAKQGVLGWRTSVFINGRRLQGRTFIPGVSQGLGEQVPNTAYRELMATAGLNLIETAALIGPLMVWSKTNGQSEPVTSARTSTQWGVLRSRRT